MTATQILDYTDKEKDWDCSGTEQSPIDFPLESSSYVDGRNKLRLLSTNYPLINGKNFEIHLEHSYGFTFEEAIGNLEALFYNKVKVKYQLINFHFHIGS